MKISNEQMITLYECLKDCRSILSFRDPLKVFYCGTRLKWSTPNCLLIVVKDDATNRYNEEMNSDIGCCGNSYIDSRWDKRHPPWSPPNKPYTYNYKVITDKTYEAIKDDWNKLADESWLYSGNSDYIPGIDITESIHRIWKLRSFA